MYTKYLVYFVIHDTYLINNVISAVKENYNIAKAIIVNNIEAVENMQYFC